MHRSLAILSSLAVTVSAVFAMGCSSKSNASTPEGGSGTCDTSMPVSFKSDVIPAFQQNCTLTQECHGQMGNSAEEDLFLGFDVGMGTTNPMDVYSMLVGVPSKEDPSMNLITAGDTSNSYLWQKVSATDLTPPTALTAACMKATAMCSDCTSTAPCGGLMPYDGETLATTDPQNLCTIQSWITQGAQNN
jgi:hypothetical protein